MVPARSRAYETLHFLLDHPRRCFVYLFPSHQTWFLLTFVVLLTLTDWVSFLVLDIGNPEIDGIPVGRRMLVGLVQSAAVRSAGFATVSLANLAPGVKVLYVIMMSVSIFLYRVIPDTHHGAWVGMSRYTLLRLQFDLPMFTRRGRWESWKRI